MFKNFLALHAPPSDNLKCTPSVQNVYVQKDIWGILNFGDKRTEKCKTRIKSSNTNLPLIQKNLVKYFVLFTNKFQCDFKQKSKINSRYFRSAATNQQGYVCTSVLASTITVKDIYLLISMTIMYFITKIAFFHRFYVCYFNGFHEDEESPSMLS